MKIKINKSKLENIISNFQPFLEKRDNSQITSHILIETQPNAVILKATDYEIGIMAKIQDETVQTEEKITVNGKEILNVLKSLKDSEIELISNENELEIKQEKTKIKLQSFIGENFTEFPKDYKNSKINIDSGSIINSLKKILPVIDANSSRIEIRNALIDIKDSQIKFVATDTKRLEVISFNNPTIEKIQFMFPRRAILEVQKFFNDQASIYFNENNIIIENDTYTFFTRIPNGNFLDYERVIPKDLNIKNKIKIDKEKMIESLKIISSVSKKVKLSFGKEKLTFESINDSDAKAMTEIEIEKEINKDFIDSNNENIEICVTTQHILEYIKNIDSTHFEFGINENKNSACLLKSDNFILVVIPTIM